VLLGVVYPEVQVAQLAVLALVVELPSLLQASLQVVDLVVPAVAPLVALPPGEVDPLGLPFPSEGAGEGRVAAVVPPLAQLSVVSA
tara:strand:- start:351 stop:608 length:258 start_codon:yes stop_codon:yes gene_type:complete